MDFELTDLTPLGEGHADGPGRILVVDDERSVAEVCHEFLTVEGHQVSLAFNAEEAIRLLPEVRPDVVLTDINLPGESGLEVMRHAKEVDPEVCVIVVTGHATTSMAIDALRQGAYDFVTKPFDLDAVHKIIKSGLAHRQLKVLNRKLIRDLNHKNEILQHHEQELREKVRIATQQMTTLYEVGKEIGANLELGPRLSVIAARAADITGAEASVIYLTQDGTLDFRVASGHGVTVGPRSDDPPHFSGNEGVLGPAVVHQRPVRQLQAEGAGSITLPGLSSDGFENLLAVPLAAEGQVIGVLAVLDKPGGFQEDDESFLVLFASQAAIAVRNSQLFAHTKRLDRLKSEFVAVVSHEIRTPLTSIKGAVELLSDDRYFQNNEQQIKLLTIAHANTERLLVLIGDILDFSKLESASLPMSIEAQRLEAVVQQATQNMRTLLEERRITLDVAMASDLPDLMMDPNRIVQVLTNLISNAIKFSPPGGRIEVTAHLWEESVRVGVRDFGEGIAPHNLPRLFQKFTQIDSSATRKAGGTGLGLVICKGIIEQHGGQISVQSTPGEGSTFYFTLPLANDRPLPGSAVESRPSSENPHAAA